MTVGASVTDGTPVTVLAVFKQRAAKAPDTVLTVLAVCAAGAPDTALAFILTHNSLLHSCCSMAIRTVATVAAASAALAVHTRLTGT